MVWSESISVWFNSEANSKKVIPTREKTLKERIDPAKWNNNPGIWEVGDPLPEVIKRITRGKILQYGKILGIGNPLHFDEAYAKRTPFKGIIAHGLMSAAYISESLMKVFPWEWVHHGEMEIQFLHPIRPGDTALTQGELKRKEPTEKGVFLVFDVQCKNQHEETVLLGTATVPIFNNK